MKDSDPRRSHHHVGTVGVRRQPTCETERGAVVRDRFRFHSAEDSEFGCFDLDRIFLHHHTLRGSGISFPDEVSAGKPTSGIFLVRDTWNKTCLLARGRHGASRQRWVAGCCVRQLQGREICITKCYLRPLQVRKAVPSCRTDVFTATRADFTLSRSFSLTRHCMCLTPCRHT